MAYAILTAQSSDDLVDELSGAPISSKPSQPAQRDSVTPADDNNIYADPPTNQPQFSSGIGQLPPSDKEEDGTTVRPSCSISSCHQHALIGGHPQSGSLISPQTHPTLLSNHQTEQVIVNEHPMATNPAPAQISTATHRQSRLTPPPSSPSHLLSPLSSPLAESK